MSGRAQLVNIVAARFERLASFAAVNHRSGDAPILTPLLFAKEGPTAIVVGIARGLAAERMFVIEGFGTFHGHHQNSDVRLEDVRLEMDEKLALHIRYQIHDKDEVLDPLLGGGAYWVEHLRNANPADGNTIRTVVTEVLQRRFHGALGTAESRATAADLTVRAFFGTTVQALNLRRPVTIGGLGNFGVDADGGIVFDASDQLRNAVHLHDLRLHKAEAGHEGIHVPVGALPEEPRITPSFVDRELMKLSSPLSPKRTEYAEALRHFLQRLLKFPAAPSV